MHRRSAIAAFLFALTACSSTPHVQVTVDAGAALPGRSCSVDAECGDLRCDPVRLQCICGSDSDCPGQFCDNFTGLCVASVPGCTAATNCGDGNFCNPDTRACEALKTFCETCNPLATPSDPACGTGNSCHADSSLGTSFCAKACTGDADCPMGATCQDLDQNGKPQCWPAPGTNCKTFTGCVPDSLSTCNSTADCQVDGGVSDQICDTNQGRCVAQEQVCALGTVCDPTNRVCVSSCTVDADCVLPDQCVNHICQPVPGCQSDTDCPANKVCNIANNAAEGQCVPFCVSDTDCPTSEICLPKLEADGTTRERCLPLCYNSTECPLNEVCVDSNDNLLQGTSDGGNYGSCSTTLGSASACQFTSACNTCQLCGTDNTCQAATSVGFCAGCNPNVMDDCHTNQHAPAGSTCLSLHGRDGNGNVSPGAPYFCGIPCETGQPDFSSIDGAQCPAGFECVALVNNAGYNCVPTNFDCTSTGAGGPVCP